MRCGGGRVWIGLTRGETERRGWRLPRLGVMGGCSRVLGFEAWGDRVEVCVSFSECVFCRLLYFQVTVSYIVFLSLCIGGEEGQWRICVREKSHSF